MYDLRVTILSETTRKELKISFLKHIDYIYIKRNNLAAAKSYIVNRTSYIY